MANEDWTFAPGGTPKQAREARERERALPAPASPPLPPAPKPRATPPPQVPTGYPPAVPLQSPTNGMAVASLVLGILGFFLPLLGILAIIFGGIGISRANQGASGKGLAVAGLVLGILVLVALLFAAASAGA